MHLSRPRTAYSPTAWVLLGILAVLPAHVHAQSIDAELVAQLGGRIVGAARACGINAERIRLASERLLHVMHDNSSSTKIRTSAEKKFATGQNTGYARVRADDFSCTSAHVGFSELEVKLGRLPSPPAAAIAARPGIPPLGALRPELSGGVRRP